jgi:hypothetical protein
MRMRFLVIIVAAFIPAALLPISFALSQKATFEYVGPDLCKMCHKSKDNSGQMWDASKHAKAMDALSTDDAKKISATAGTDEKCLACHNTGVGAPTGFKSGADNKKTQNVTCEACHGPGSGYKTVMTKMPDVYTNGLITPSVAVCVKCHNKMSPSYKDFHFREAFAAIRHGKEDDMKTPVAMVAYIGETKCAMCHKNRDTSVSTWEGSKHAKAFDALKSDDAKKYSPDPTNDPFCLGCHVTGLTDAGGYVLYPEKDKEKDAADLNAKMAGVQCEACHGPGEKYMKTMSSKDDSAKNGLEMPTEKTCRRCHNALSPTYKDFNFDEAAKLIAHGKK